MDSMSVSSSVMADTMNSSTKRKRSLSPAQPPPIKVAKTHSSHLQINYLTRQYSDILPLIASDDSLPSLLSLVQDYDGVLHRHESMAGNLGARPLGPMLIKRFERLFDGPPKVLKTHGKEGTTVGWLDVVDFARNKPEQFNLEKTRDGHPVCQFYTKQSRVEITEEDHELIASGMPQRLIPPQPIVEDEEKELGTLEILEKNLGHIVQLADQVSARARQLNHRLKNRKNAIIARRESEALSSNSPYSPHSINGTRASVSPSSGFVAVNARTSDTNGTPTHTASAATRAELLSKFFTTSERARAAAAEDALNSNPGSRPLTGTNEMMSPSKPKVASGSVHEGSEHANATLFASTSPNPVSNTPSSLLPYTKATPAERFDDAGPYKAEMVARMEQLQRGDRIVPPCDRCRRLHMDCCKNLTACLGCTRKHAKCSWKDVEDDELKNYEPPAARHRLEDEVRSERSASTGPRKRDYRRDGQGVADEELLGEEVSSSDEDEPHQRHLTPRSQEPIQVHVAGTVATRASPSSQARTESPPEQPSIMNLDGGVEPLPQLSERLPSPPPAPVPTHAELATMPAEIEMVEEVQASRIPDTMEVQPTVEGFASINGSSVLQNGLGAGHTSNDGYLNDAATTIWTQAPLTPPTPPTAPVVAPILFSDQPSKGIESLTSVAPLADMGRTTEI